MINIEKIRELREKNQLTLNELSAKSGISYSTLTGFSKHKTTNLDVVISLCKVFKVRVEDIITESWEVETVPEQAVLSDDKLEIARLKDKIIELQEKLLKQKEV